MRLCYLPLLLTSVAASVAATPGSVQRLAPPLALPNIPFPLTNLVSFTAAVSNYAVEEQLPEGWIAFSISDGGHFDTATQKIKWGPFLDGTARAFSCIVTPSTNTGLFILSGKGSFDGVEAATSPTMIRVLGINESNHAEASLPAVYSPGAPLDLIIDVQPAANLINFAVEDSIPQNWTASAFSEGGGFVAGKLRWGPFFSSAPRQLRCTLTPPANANAEVIFIGTASFDGVETPIGGARVIKPVGNRIIRSLPGSVRAGSSFVLSNYVSPTSLTFVYAIEEQLPDGWTATEINEGGSVDVRKSALKWGPFFDQTERILTARLTAPANSTGTILFAGVGSFNGVDSPIAGSAALPIGVNHSPLAANDVFTRPMNLPISIPFTRLLANDSDPDSDTFTISFPSTTILGIPLTLSAGALTYAPPAGQNHADTFSYIIRDPDGLAATAVVTIQPPDGGQTQNVTSIRSTATAILVQFAGIPGFEYEIQTATALQPANWTTSAHSVADQDGHFSYTDPLPTGPAQRFYRTFFLP